MKPAIVLTVTAIQQPRYRLHFVLTNSSAHSTTCYESQLPWGNRYSLILVAVLADGPGTVLEHNDPIDDPGPKAIAINAGETLTGDVDLETRFPGLREATAERDVVLFWSYQFRAIDAPPEPRTGGYLLLPTRGHSKEHPR